MKILERENSSNVLEEENTINDSTYNKTVNTICEKIHTYVFNI